MKKMNKEEDTHKHFQALTQYTCTITLQLYRKKFIKNFPKTRKEQFCCGVNFVFCTFAMHLVFDITASLMAIDLESLHHYKIIIDIIIIITTNTMMEITV